MQSFDNAKTKKIWSHDHDKKTGRIWTNVCKVIITHISWNLSSFVESQVRFAPRTIKIIHNERRKLNDGNYDILTYTSDENSDHFIVRH